MGVLVLVGLWKKDNWWVFLYFSGFVLGVEERKTGGLSVLGWADGGCSCPCHVVEESGELAGVLVFVGFRVKAGRKERTGGLNVLGWVGCGCS